MKKKPTEAEAVKKVHKKPRGPNKKDNLGQPCKWNEDEGRWERDPGLQPEGWEVDPNDLTKWVDPNAAPKRKVGRRAPSPRLMKWRRPRPRSRKRAAAACSRNGGRSCLR